MQQGRAERVAIFALEIKTCQHCSFSCKPDHTQAQQRQQAQAQEANEILPLPQPGGDQLTPSAQRHGGDLSISPCLFLSPVWPAFLHSLAVQALLAEASQQPQSPCQVPMAILSLVRGQSTLPTSWYFIQSGQTPASNQVLSFYCSVPAPGGSVPALVLELLRHSRLWAGQCTQQHTGSNHHTKHSSEAEGPAFATSASINSVWVE